METKQLKNRIQGFLEHADDRVLNIVNNIFENYYLNETVAYHPDGVPMTREEYKAALDTAEEQIKKGQYISVEELERKMNEQ